MNKKKCCSTRSELDLSATVDDVSPGEMDGVKTNNELIPGFHKDLIPGWNDIKNLGFTLGTVALDLKFTANATARCICVDKAGNESMLASASITVGGLHANVEIPISVGGGSWGMAARLSKLRLKGLSKLPEVMDAARKADAVVALLGKICSSVAK